MARGKSCACVACSAPAPALHCQPHVGTPISTRERGATRSTVRSVFFQNASDATGPGSLRGPCSFQASTSSLRGAPARAGRTHPCAGLAACARAAPSRGSGRAGRAGCAAPARTRRSSRATLAGRSRQSSTTPLASSARSATLRRRARRRRSGPFASSSPARCFGSASTGTSRAPRAVSPAVNGSAALYEKRPPGSSASHAGDSIPIESRCAESEPSAADVGCVAVSATTVGCPAGRAVGRAAEGAAAAAVAAQSDVRTRARRPTGTRRVCHLPSRCGRYGARQTSGAEAATASSSRSKSARGESVGTSSKRAMRIGSVARVSRPNVGWPSSLKPRL